MIVPNLRILASTICDLEHYFFLLPIVQRGAIGTLDALADRFLNVLIDRFNVPSRHAWLNISALDRRAPIRVAKHRLLHVIGPLRGTSDSAAAYHRTEPAQRRQAAPGGPFFLSSGPVLEGRSRAELGFITSFIASSYEDVPAVHADFRAVWSGHHRFATGSGRFPAGRSSLTVAQPCDRQVWLPAVADCVEQLVWPSI